MRVAVKFIIINFIKNKVWTQIKKAFLVYNIFLKYHNHGCSFSLENSFWMYLV